MVPRRIVSSEAERELDDEGLLVLFPAGASNSVDGGGGGGRAVPIPTSCGGGDRGLSSPISCGSNPDSEGVSGRAPLLLPMSCDGEGLFSTPISFLPLFLLCPS
jgi:hypothetical protein